MEALGLMLLNAASYMDPERLIITGARMVSFGRPPTELPHWGECRAC